jgi:ribonuclease HI
LLPGFTLWQIWKEQNKRIFHSQPTLPAVNWAKIRSQIIETIRSKSWTEKDWQCSPEEQNILQSWQPILTNPIPTRNHTGQPTSPNTWTPPPEHFIKVNFDGASKGNPGPAGYGAVLRNSGGEILGLDEGFIGDSTNNVAELTGLLRGLHTTIDRGHQKIILEGDSQIITRLATKIIHGCDPEKISPSWRLYSLLAEFSHHLQPHLTITTSHVKRDANRVADQLANEAVEQEEEHINWEGPGSPAPEILTRCQALAINDLHSPDRVTDGTIVPCGNEPGRCFNASTGSYHLGH